MRQTAKASSHERRTEDSHSDPTVSWRLAGAISPALMRKVERCLLRSLGFAA